MNRVANQGGSLFWKLAVVVFAAALAATIIIPQRERAEQDYIVKLTRMHLVDLFLAEEFYFQGRQYYASDPESLLSYINNVRSMRVDTVGIAYYAVGDTTIRDTDLWKIVEPRERLPHNQILSTYISPVDSSTYLLIVKDDGISIIVKDRHGIGRIENGEASWHQSGGSG